MANKIFQAILDQKIEFFKSTFSNTAMDIYWDEKAGKLIHPGEFGSYREFACKEFLRAVVPTKYDIGSGFLINSSGGVSTQCDIVIYDRNNTPLIVDNNNQRFFPVETVCGIGEVKSNLNLKEFKAALNKLAKNKKLREDITDPYGLRNGLNPKYNPQANPTDQIFTFLICNKLTFDLKNISNRIDTFYDNTLEHRQKHNLILSLSDGLITYNDEKNHNLMYPNIGDVRYKHKLVAPKTNPNSHIYMASASLFTLSMLTNLYFLDFAFYLDFGKSSSFRQE